MTKNHPRNIEGIELEDLAKKLGGLTYDRLAEFIGHLSDELYRQYQGDMSRNRPKLATQLFCAVEHLENTKGNIESAWRICLPYMTLEEKGPAEVRQAWMRKMGLSEDEILEHAQTWPPTNIAEEIEQYDAMVAIEKIEKSHDSDKAGSRQVD